MFNSKKKICPIAKNFVTVKTSAKVLFSILIQTRESVHGRRIPQLKPLLTQELKGPVKAVLSKVSLKVKSGIHNLISKEFLILAFLIIVIFMIKTLCLGLQLTSNPKFFVEDKGSTLCGGGYAIMGANKCKEACKALNLPQMTISGSNICYKDNDGKCWQDGQERWAKNRYGVSMICEKMGKLL